MKKACHFGAGNIGRGFIGLILNQAGYQVSFADVNASLIQQLNESKKYPVETLSMPSKRYIVDVELCFDINKDADQLIKTMSTSDLITTAVGPNILPKIAPLFAKALEAKYDNQIFSYLNIIACENVIGGSELLKNEIFKYLNDSAKSFVSEWVGFPNSAVDRIVPIQNNIESLLVKVEDYYEWVIDSLTSKGDLLIDGAIFTEKLDAFIERKLYLVNAGHAAIAYMGYQRGYTTICEALQDDEVMEHVYSQMLEAAKLLELKHGFNIDELEKYAQKTLKRFSNPEITDSVYRVGRSLMRKLSPNDRFIKPLLELYQYQCDSKHFETSVHYALMFDYSEDDEAVYLNNKIKEVGIVNALVDLWGIPSNHPLINAIVELRSNRTKLSSL
ncbi:MAG: mannitol-1-phosphate 5-dehydrogenase [Erysipelothrix sp.]|nr:mannitol-1-phosphate 5-dehydrogenase [Erysipelothrix sp.]